MIATLSKRILYCGLLFGLFVCPLVVVMPVSADNISVKAIDVKSMTVNNGHDSYTFSLPLTWQDQHQQDHVIDNHTRWVLFSRTMAASELVQAAIDSHQGSLPAEIVYIADLSNAPSLIRRFIILPQLQEMSYSVAIDPNGEQSQSIPTQNERLTLIELQQLQIQSVHYLDDPKSLQQLFETGRLSQSKVGLSG